MILLVYQIKNYCTLIKFNLFRIVSKDILILIKSIVNRCLKSSRLLITSTSTQKITNSITQSKSIKSLIFFENWEIDRAHFLSNIRKFSDDVVIYRAFFHFLNFKEQAFDDIISVFSKNSIHLLTNITFDKFSLKSRLLQTSKSNRFVSIDSLKFIKFANFKQESSIAFIISRSIYLYLFLSNVSLLSRSFFHFQLLFQYLFRYRNLKLFKSQSRWIMIYWLNYSDKSHLFNKNIAITICV